MNLNFFINLLGARNVANSIRRVDQAFQRMGRSVDRGSRAINNNANAMGAMQGRMSNIQAGLVQVSHYLLIMNTRINNVFARMTKRFTDAEDAMVRLKTTMGLAGETSLTSPKRYQELLTSTKLIKELAATTEFTQSQIATAFKSLIQSGRTAEEAQKMIRSTLQLATASGGIIDLGEATEVAALAIGTLGVKAEQVPETLNMMFRTAQKTKVGFDDLSQVMGGLKSAFTNLGGEGVDRAAALMVMSAALMTQGDAARGAGQHVKQFTETLLGMSQAASKNILYKQAGKGKGRARIAVKREELLNFFGVREFDVGQLQKILNTSVDDIRILRDEYIKRQLAVFTKAGKYEQRTAQSLLSIFSARFGKLMEQRGALEAKRITKAAFGKGAGTLMLEAIVGLAKQAGVETSKAGDHFINMINLVKQNQRDLMKGEAEAQKTLSYRMKVLESATTDLSNAIFKHDIVAGNAIEAYKEMISSTSTLMKNNEGLAKTVSMLGRSLQLLSGVGANLGFTLVAMATFSYGLTRAIGTTTVAAAGLGTTLRAFGTMFLAPTMTLLVQFAGAIGVASLGLVALVRYMGGEGSTVTSSFKKILDDLKSSAQATGGMINLMFHKDTKDKSVLEQVSRFYEIRKRLVGLRENELKAGGRYDKLLKLDRERSAYFEEQVSLMKLLDGTALRDPKVEKRFAGLDDFALREAKVAQKEYNNLSNEMTKIKGILKEAGFTGLYALEGRGEQVVLTIAKVLDSLRALVDGFKMIAEAALIPLMFGIRQAISLVGIAFDVILAPIKMFIYFIGLANDEASATRKIFEILGYVIGGLASIALIKTALVGVRGAVLFVFGAVGRLTQGVTNLVASILRLNTGLISNQRMLIRCTNGAAHYVRTIDVMRSSLLASTSGFARFGRGLQSVTAYMARSSGYLLMIGTVLSMMGEDTFSPWLIGAGLLLPMLSSLVSFIMTTLIPALMTLNASLGVFGLIGLVLGAIGVGVVGYKALKDDTPTGSKPSRNLNAKPTAMRYTPSGAYEKLMGVQSSGAVSPTTASFSQPATVYGGATGRTVSEVTNDHSVTYNINRMTVKASNPQELGVALKKKSSGRGGFEASMMG